MEVPSDIYNLPGEFSGSREEYLALKEGAGFLPLSCLEQSKITGGDRTRFLHSMLAQDIKSLKPFQAAFSSATDNKGKMVSHLIAMNLDDCFLLLCAPGTGERLKIHLNKHIISDDVVVERTEESPFAEAFLLLGAKAGERAASLNIEDRNLFHLKNSLGDLFLIIRYAGDAGGEPHKLEDDLSKIAVKTGFRAFDRFRIESGFPLFGIDIGTETVPVEAGLSCSYSLTKGCFLGQEAIAMMTHRGHPAKKLVKLALEDKEFDIQRGHPVFCGEEEAGYITSGVFSPETRAVTMLGFIRWRFLDGELSVKLEEGIFKIKRLNMTK